jgi:paraquat-inducible protein A
MGKAGAMNRGMAAAMLFAASVSFALGVTLPVVKVDRLYVFSQEPSLLQITGSLVSEGDWGLAIVIGGLSILFPAVKLLALHLGMVGDPDHHNSRLARAMKMLANWSMLDVVLVALVVFAAKTSGLADAATRPGLWFFGLSAVLTAILTRLSARVGPTADQPQAG